MSNKKNRNILVAVVAVVAVVLTVAAFVAHRVFEEPGHAEMKAGRADFRRGNFASAIRHYTLATIARNTISESAITRAEASKRI